MVNMSSETHPRNQVGTPPPGRSIHKRRKDIEPEQGAEESLGNPLIVSIIAFGAVLALGLVVAWLVL